MRFTKHCLTKSSKVFSKNYWKNSLKN